MKSENQLLICFYIFFLSILPFSPAVSETTGKWVQESPYPQTNDLNRVWGTAADDVFAVGNSGTIIHYDGDAWTVMENPLSGTTNWLNSVWGSSGKDVFAVGGKGIILHYDGTEWTQMESGTDQSLRSVWGTSGNQVFAVGNADTALMYDGTKWTDVPVDVSDISIPPYELTLFDVFGHSPDRIFAISCDTVFRYDGTAFTKISPTDPDGCSACGYGCKTIYDSTIREAPGTQMLFAAKSVNHIMDYYPYSGIVRKFDGNTWTEIPLTAEEQIEVTGYDSEGNPYIHTVRNSLSFTIYDMWIFSEKDIFATGIQSDSWSPAAKVIIHYDGNEWTRMLRGDCKSIWGSSPDDVFAVGSDGNIFHYDGTAWTQMSRNITSQELKAVWGTSEDNIYAVGQHGTILHFTAGEWATMTSPVSEDFNDIWGSGENDIFVAGNDSTIIHYNGTEWSLMAIPEDSGNITDIWGNSGNDVFAIGSAGKILHYDGIAWAAMESGTDESLYSIWGSSGNNIFAGGDSVILHYDGTGWSEPLYNQFSHSIYAIWGSSGNDIYFGGGGLHYDGQHWASFSSDFPDALDISGTSASNIFAVGESGNIQHYNGSAWTKMGNDISLRLNGVWAASETNAIAVGNGGMILRYKVSEVSQADRDSSGGCFIDSADPY